MKNKKNKKMYELFIILRYPDGTDENGVLMEGYYANLKAIQLLLNTKGLKEIRKNGGYDNLPEGTKVSALIRKKK